MGGGGGGEGATHVAHGTFEILGGGGGGGGEHQLPATPYPNQPHRQTHGGGGRGPPCMNPCVRAYSYGGGVLVTAGVNGKTLGKLPFLPGSLQSLDWNGGMEWWNVFYGVKGHC